ncbi:hypothetical protein [Amycolatopsis coloradensis]|uniref:hypothetical protein n=1 Tax=Amycolatopsis coloradensis TaxID=76021 RepID=UPI00130129AC|nr:hypothetical protein [Amycolatopsis coloradensis]
MKVTARLDRSGGGQGGWRNDEVCLPIAEQYRRCRIENAHRAEHKAVTHPE